MNNCIFGCPRSYYQSMYGCVHKESKPRAFDSMRLRVLQFQPNKNYVEQILVYFSCRTCMKNKQNYLPLSSKKSLDLNSFSPGRVEETIQIFIKGLIQ